MVYHFPEIGGQRPKRRSKKLNNNNGLRDFVMADSESVANNITPNEINGLIGFSASNCASKSEPKTSGILGPIPVVFFAATATFTILIAWSVT